MAPGIKKSFTTEGTELTEFSELKNRDESTPPGKALLGLAHCLAKALYHVSTSALSVSSVVK